MARATITNAYCDLTNWTAIYKSVFIFIQFSPPVINYLYTFGCTMSKSRLLCDDLACTAQLPSRSYRGPSHWTTSWCFGLLERYECLRSIFEEWHWRLPGLSIYVGVQWRNVATFDPNAAPPSLRAGAGLRNWSAAHAKLSIVSFIYTQVS